VDEGVDITHPLTLNGGTFDDGSSLTTPLGSGHFLPVIQIFDTTEVTLANVTIEGANLNGRYHPLLVGEAGVKVVSSSDVTLDDISVSNVFGDGLELVADLGHRNPTPDTNLVVDGYDATMVGRQGVTFAEVEHATLNDINISDPDFDGFDFESDIPNLGSGYVAITNCTYQKGINLVEPLYGPLSVTDCAGGSWAYLLDGKTDEPITFTDDTMRCENRAPISCIRLGGGQATISHSAITRIKEPPNLKVTEPAWWVFGTGHLTLDHTSVAGPTGSHASTARVDIRS
jgi:hypothetical protein